MMLMALFGRMLFVGGGASSDKVWLAYACAAAVGVDVGVSVDFDGAEHRCWGLVICS